jgi:hypothetical protein
MFRMLSTYGTTIRTALRDVVPFTSRISRVSLSPLSCACYDVNFAQEDGGYIYRKHDCRNLIIRIPLLSLQNRYYIVLFRLFVPHLEDHERIDNDDDDIYSINLWRGGEGEYPSGREVRRHGIWDLLRGGSCSGGVICICSGSSEFTSSSF